MSNKLRAIYGRILCSRKRVQQLKKNLKVVSLHLKTLKTFKSVRV